MASKSCRTERLLIGPFLRKEPPSAGTRDECYTPSSVLISTFARYDSNQLIFTTIVIGNTTCLRECAPVCPYSHSAFASIDYLQVSRRRQPADPSPVEEPKREKKKRKEKKNKQTTAPGPSSEWVLRSAPFTRFYIHYSNSLPRCLHCLRAPRYASSKSRQSRSQFSLHALLRYLSIYAYQINPPFLIVFWDQPGVNSEKSP